MFFESLYVCYMLPNVLRSHFKLGHLKKKPIIIPYVSMVGGFETLLLPIMLK